MSLGAHVVRIHLDLDPVLALALACFALLIGIWLAYPLVVGLAALAARRRPADAPVGSATGAPIVSVILATREGSAAIRARVDDVRRADYPAESLEVVVGLDATRPAGDVPTFEDPRVRVVPGDAPGGKAAALNAAVRAARGEVLVFTDTAQRFAPDAIRRLVTTLETDRRLGAVSGALQIGSDGRVASPAELYWRLERWLRDREARLHSTVGVTGAIYAQRRAAWVPLPAGLILDDVYGPMRMVLDGWRVGFCRDAVAVDERRFAARQEYARKVRTLTGNIQLCAWLPAILVPVRNPIWLQFICHKLLRLLTPYIMVVMLIALSLALPGMVVRVLGPRLPDGAGLPVALLGVGLVLAPLASRRVREALAGTLALQAAVVQATINGFRGRWDVWS